MPRRPPSSREPSSSSRLTEGGPEDLLRAALVGILRGYRLLVSPLLPASCRFAPSCSLFAIEAIRVHGARRGLLLAIGRLARCHPWHAGGYDPVPSGRRC